MVRMIELQAKQRSILGKKIRSIRSQGETPAILYGGGEKNTPLFVSTKEFQRIFREAGESSIVTLHIEGSGTKNVLIHDVARDPISGKPTHVDFYAVRMDKPIEATVPLVFEGEAEAVKALGGVLVKVLHELKMEVLPKDLPHEIVIDISVLRTFEDQVLVKHITLPTSAHVLVEGDQVVALVEPPRTQEELDAESAPISLDSIEVAGKKEKEEESSEEESS